MSEIATIDALPIAAGVVDQFKSGNAPVFSTFTGQDFDTRKAVVKAMTDASPLEEMLDKPFNLANFVIQEITIRDDKTGEEIPTARTILVTDKGENYAAVSDGIVRALQNFVGIMGMPSEWPAPQKVVASREKSRGGFNYFTLKLA